MKEELNTSSEMTAQGKKLEFNHSEEYPSDKFFNNFRLKPKDLFAPWKGAKAAGFVP